VFGIADLVTTILAVQYLNIGYEGNPLVAPLIGTGWFVIVKTVGTLLTSVLVYLILILENGWIVNMPKLAVLAQVLVVMNNGIVIIRGSIL